MPSERHDRFWIGYAACLITVAAFTTAWWAWDNWLAWVAG